MQSSPFSFHSTVLDKSVSKFSNFLLLGCLFSSFLFELRSLSCSPPVSELQNQIVGGVSQNAPRLCSTCSLLLGHSSGDLWTASENAFLTCRLPHTARHTIGTTIAQAGRQTRVHTQCRHAHTHYSSGLLKSQRRVHYRTIQVYIKSP